MGTLAKKQLRKNRPNPEEESRIFVCAGCKRATPWSRGADDDLPHHCDDCWVLFSAAPDLLAALEWLLPIVPATWSGCVRPGDWKGPGAERITNVLAECQCVNHTKLRAAVAAVAKARGK